MSNPNLKSELHDLVLDYVSNHLGEPGDGQIFHEMIDNPSLRNDEYDCFLEWVLDQ